MQNTSNGPNCRRLTDGGHTLFERLAPSLTFEDAPRFVLTAEDGAIASMDPTIARPRRVHTLTPPLLRGDSKRAAQQLFAAWAGEDASGRPLFTRTPRLLELGTLDPQRALAAWGGDRIDGQQGPVPFVADGETVFRLPTAPVPSRKTDWGTMLRAYAPSRNLPYTRAQALLDLALEQRPRAAEVLGWVEGFVHPIAHVLECVNGGASRLHYVDARLLRLLTLLWPVHYWRFAPQESGDSLLYAHGDDSTRNVLAIVRALQAPASQLGVDVSPEAADALARRAL